MGFVVVMGALVVFYILAQIFSPNIDQIAYMRKRCSNKLERRVFDHLVSFGVVPTVQHKVGKYRLDFALFSKSGAKLDIECDGYIFHNNPKAKAKDRARDAFLKKEGWRVVRLAEEDLKEDFHGAMRKAEISIYEMGMLPENHPAMRLKT